LVDVPDASLIRRWDRRFDGADESLDLALYANVLQTSGMNFLLWPSYVVLCGICLQKRHVLTSGKCALTRQNTIPRFFGIMVSLRLKAIRRLICATQTLELQKAMQRRSGSTSIVFCDENRKPMSIETRKYSIAADYDLSSDISADSDAMVEYLTYLAAVQDGLIDGMGFTLRDFRRYIAGLPGSGTRI
jgi:hypothetical protein